MDRRGPGVGRPRSTRRSGPRHRPAGDRPARDRPGAGRGPEAARRAEGRGSTPLAARAGRGRAGARAAPRRGARGHPGGRRRPRPSSAAPQQARDEVDGRLAPDGARSLPPRAGPRRGAGALEQAQDGPGRGRGGRRRPPRARFSSSKPSSPRRGPTGTSSARRWRRRGSSSPNGARRSRSSTAASGEMDRSAAQPAGRPARAAPAGDRGLDRAGRRAGAEAAAQTGARRPARRRPWRSPRSRSRTIRARTGRGRAARSAPWRPRRPRCGPRPMRPTSELSAHEVRLAEQRQRAQFLAEEVDPGIPGRRRRRSTGSACSGTPTTSRRGCRPSIWTSRGGGPTRRRGRGGQAPRAAGRASRRASRPRPTWRRWTPPTGTQSRREVDALRQRLAGMGAVNLVAIEEYAELKQRHDFLRAQSGDLTRRQGRAAQGDRRDQPDLPAAVRRSPSSRSGRTSNTPSRRSSAAAAPTLELIQAEDILESGIEIVAQPPGTKLKGITPPVGRPEGPDRGRAPLRPLHGQAVARSASWTSSTPRSTSRTSGASPIC